MNWILTPSASLAMGRDENQSAVAQETRRTRLSLETRWPCGSAAMVCNKLWKHLAWENHSGRVLLGSRLRFFCGHVNVSVKKCGYGVLVLPSRPRGLVFMVGYECPGVEEALAGQWWQ